jgi:hyperosmotically inducible periplasmic protein
MKKPHFLIALAALAGALGLTGLQACSESSNAAKLAGVTEAGTTAGTEIDDTIVTTRVKAALLADQDLKSFDFRVETRKGEVQLSGFVQNLEQFERAAELSRAIPGVRGVQNSVALKGNGRSVGTKVDDIIITARVHAALLADASVSSGDITVVTQGGDVQLSGFLNNQRQIERALKVAGQVQNVAKVSNEMSVKQ